MKEAKQDYDCDNNSNSLTLRRMVMDPPPAAKVKEVLYVTYLIAALDVTWLFLQFSITPVGLDRFERQ